MHGSASTTTAVANEVTTRRRAVYRALEIDQEKNWVSRSVDIFLITLISASVVAVILESMPGFEKLRSRHWPTRKNTKASKMKRLS